jgi:hypothetical protein
MSVVNVEPKRLTNILGELNYGIMEQPEKAFVLNQKDKPKKKTRKTRALIEHPSGVKLEENVHTWARMGERDEQILSDHWDLVDHPTWLESKSREYLQGPYRRLLMEVQDSINRAFSRTGQGSVAILAIGMNLIRLKRNLVVLTAKKSERKWGDRRGKIEVLKQYRCSEYLFDTNPDIRKTVLGVIMGEIEDTEELIRKTAKQYGIEIPISTYYDKFPASEFEAAAKAFLEGEK